MLSEWAAARPADTELMMLLAHNPTATPETLPEASKMAIVGLLPTPAASNSLGTPWQR